MFAIRMLTVGICEQIHAMRVSSQTAFNLACASEKPLSRNAAAMFTSLSLSMRSDPPPWVFMAVSPMPAEVHASTAAFMPSLFIRRKL